MQNHYEGQYLPPEGHEPEPDPPAGRTPAAEPQRKNRLRAAAGGAVGLGLLVAKFKSLLFVLLSFKWIALGLKFALSSGTILASVWFYALVFGWKLGVVFVFLILIHECGHLYMARAYGIPMSLPYFIPGLGAFVTMKAMPASAAQEAAIGIAGPVAGTLAALACYGYGVATGNPFWIACAHIGFFLNLFNMFPVLPLDGGRVAGAISPRIWIFGIVAFLTFLIATRSFSGFTFVIVLLLVVPSIPRALRAWRGVPEECAERLTAGQRAATALGYFGLVTLLALGVMATKAAAA